MTRSYSTISIVEANSCTKCPSVKFGQLPLDWWTTSSLNLEWPWKLSRKVNKKSLWIESKNILLPRFWNLTLMKCAYWQFFSKAVKRKFNSNRRRFMSLQKSIRVLEQVDNWILFILRVWKRLKRLFFDFYDCLPQRLCFLILLCCWIIRNVSLLEKCANIMRKRKKTKMFKLSG